MSHDNETGEYSIYDELRAEFFEDNNNNKIASCADILLFDVLDRALRIVLDASQQQSKVTPPHGSQNGVKKKLRCEELTRELFSLVEKAGRLPIEYPEHVAQCLQLARQGAELDDVGADNIMHRSILDVICRCGLTCHLMALIVDGQVSAAQLFSVHEVKCNSLISESPFTSAVISNKTKLVFLITKFNELDTYDDDVNSDSDSAQERLCTALRTKGLADRVPLHYCAMNRNKALFKTFEQLCPDTLFYFDKSQYIPALYMTTAWADAYKTLDDTIYPEKYDDNGDLLSDEQEIATKLMTAWPSSGPPPPTTDEEHAIELAAAGAAVACSNWTTPEARSVKAENPTGIKQENGEMSAGGDSVEEKLRRFRSCTLTTLKYGRNLISWAAQDGTVNMLSLLLETFATVTHTTVCPNGIYFQHLLRYYPYECEPILDAYTAGAEVNFLQLLFEASADLFCDQPLAACRPPVPSNPCMLDEETMLENETLNVVQLVRKYFLDDSKNGLASSFMASIVTNIVNHARRAPSQTGVISIENAFMKTKSAIKKFQKNDIACQQERAVLLFDTNADDSLPMTRNLKKSFSYLQQSTLSVAARQKLFEDAEAETILMPKLRCDCEFFEVPCATNLKTEHEDWPPPTKSCPCLGPLAQIDEVTKQPVSVPEEAARWTLIPDLHTFPKMAPYCWLQRADLTERKGPLVFDLRVVEPEKMAFIYACSDECRCDEANCPTSTVFAPSRCCFSVIDTTSGDKPKRLGILRYGLRTRENIFEGQFVGKIVGNLLTPKDVEDLERESVFDGDVFSTARWQYCKRLPLPFGAEFVEQMSDLQKEAFDFYIDQYLSGNFTRFIRHSCEPNLSVHVMLPRGTADMRQRVMVLFAKKSMASGEELTMDFGDWFLQRPALQNKVCGCSEVCRKPG